MPRDRPLSDPMRRVLRSLRKSRGRCAVLSLLVRYGSLSVAGIAERLGFEQRAVVGALVGQGKRYAWRRSLVGLGLVYVVPGDDDRASAFAATPLGRRVATWRSTSPRRWSPRWPVLVKTRERRP